MKFLQGAYLRYLMHILSTPGQRRHALRWYLSLRPNYLLDTPSPWICFDAVAFLKRWLGTKDDLRIFEYGSGGSSLFWLTFKASVVSVEHDPAWYAVVSQRIFGNPLIDYRLVIPEFRGTGRSESYDPSDPTRYSSGGALLRDYDFSAYARQIDEFPADYFDAVLIDGRARPACLMHSAGKVKVGGCLILDNADNAYYLEKTRIFLKDFSRHELYGVGPCGLQMWQTNIYLREDPQTNMGYL